MDCGLCVCRCVNTSALHLTVEIIHWTNKGEMRFTNDDGERRKADATAVVKIDQATWPSNHQSLDQWRAIVLCMSFVLYFFLLFFLLHSLPCHLPSNTHCYSIQCSLSLHCSMFNFHLPVYQLATQVKSTVDNSLVKK